MPPKRGPAARKLHDSLPPKTEIPCKIYSPLVITKEIGKGGFGRIYSGKTKDTKEDVAIKVEQNGSGGLFVEFQIFRSFLSEKDLNEYKKQKRLQFLGLPHFVAWGVFTHKGTELRFVAMPLYTGSLQEYINKKSGKVLDVDECKEIVPTVCDAYDYLHSKDIVHADLKAENLMFSKPYPNRLDRLTLIDFGMCGRRSHEIIDQPDKGKAHNGTALFTSTDAHRGCAPSYRADYEILGHNLLAWLAGVQNVPWNNIITKLDQVHSLKSKIIDSKGEIQKLVGSPEAASLVYEVYQVAKKTNYKDKVDSSKIKRLVSSIKSPKKSVTTPKSKKKSSAEQESPSSSAIVIPSSPPRPITPRKTKKSASEQPEISLEAQRRAQAEEREARAKRRNRVDAIPEEEEIENRKRRSEEPEDSGESKRSKVENKPKSPAKKAKKANSLMIHRSSLLNPKNFREICKKSRFSSHKTADRGDFGRLEDKDLSAFERICGSNNVLKDDLDPYNIDFVKWYKGKSSCVLTPESSEQISALLRHCHDRKLAICPQAGNTGLVGGSVPVHDEVIISIKKLRTHYNLDQNSGILECDAGFVLQELDEKLAQDGFMMPIDLGAKGSCLIGGNIATNAGGVRLVRYGSLNANVLSLQVAIPDAQGTLLQLGAPLRKDNSDLKLQQLFIGSEGQLGLITRCAILVPPKPKSVQLAFLGTKSFADCCAVLRACKKMLGEILSSFELMDSESMRCVQENVALESVLDSKPAFNLLIETSGSNPDHDAEKMENLLSHCMDTGLATDGVMAQSGKDSELFWKIRENASLALNLDGYVYKHDVSLPLAHFYELSEVIRDRLKGSKAKRVVTFGHLGDGNSHLNVTAEQFDQEVYDRLYPFIYDWTASHNGSISAEHGIGRLKRTHHHKLVDKTKQAINSEIKKAFDPKGILSPYKMID